MSNMCECGKEILRQICVSFGLNLDGDVVYMYTPLRPSITPKKFYINALDGELKEITDEDLNKEEAAEDSESTI